MGGNPEEEVCQRGYDSLTDDDEDGHGLEYAMGDDDEQMRKGTAIADVVHLKSVDFA